MESLELFRGTKISEQDASKSDDTFAGIEEENDDEEVAAKNFVSEEDLLALLSSFRSSLRESSDAVLNGIDAEAPTGGMSLLTLKNLLMADYLENLLEIAKAQLQPLTVKLSNKIARNDSFQKAAERLVQLRVIIERIRPVESKLKGLMDRLVKQANQKKNFAFSEVTESSSANASLRARPEDMVLDDDDEEDEEKESGEDGEREESDGDVEERPAKTKKYKPPQLSAAYYDPDWEQSASGANRRGKSATSAEHRMMVREMMARAELDEPEEITNEEEGMGYFTAAEKRRKQAEEQHRQRYEEDNFIRLPVAKNKQHLPTVGTADRVLLYGRDGADDDDLRVFASNDNSAMPSVGFAAAGSKKRSKKLAKQLKRKKGKSKGGSKRAKRPRRK